MVTLGEGLGGVLPLGEAGGDEDGGGDGSGSLDEGFVIAVAVAAGEDVAFVADGVVIAAEGVVEGDEEELLFRQAQHAGVVLDLDGSPDDEAGNAFREEAEL